jgi:hypothetical protein
MADAAAPGGRCAAARAGPSQRRRVRPRRRANQVQADAASEEARGDRPSNSSGAIGSEFLTRICRAAPRSRRSTSPECSTALGDVSERHRHVLFGDLQRSEEPERASTKTAPAASREETLMFNHRLTRAAAIAVAIAAPAASADDHWRTQPAPPQDLRGADARDAAEFRGIYAQIRPQNQPPCGTCATPTRATSRTAAGPTTPPRPSSSGRRRPPSRPPPVSTGRTSGSAPAGCWARA